MIERYSASASAFYLKRTIANRIIVSFLGVIRLLRRRPF